ncbi:ABC transporter substrate-binding protein [Mesorhizobium sp.]|uniref:ABC transporter substrate-binding protein n=1 Tax=Mesorhizobium sp. TaxID=1871066 RepID=UPI000FE4BBA0|nr:ABC transporter substrate-binding protein [Mesorhizobium sp.]RWB69910.1 MAG: ABC transporter substrate-binding protein [Mesorhizobium sp.]
MSDRPRHPNSTSRRNMLKLAGFALTTPALLRASWAAAEQPVTYVGWGGAAEEASRAAVIDPFIKETGIAVQIVSGPDLSKARGQVMSGQIEWDVINTAGFVMTSGEEAGIWETLPPDLVPASDLKVPMRKSSAPFMQYAGVMAYAPGRSGDKFPRTFKDFFDPDNFPGRRGLRTYAGQTLEMALLADGVPPQSLYPLDVERAFAKLDKMKPHVAKWIEQTQQTISLLQNGEIDFSFTYNGRVESARASGIDIDFSRDQSLILTQYLAVLKGSPRAEKAFKLISYFMDPARQAELSRLYFSIPTRISAKGLIRPEIAARLPDLSNPNNVLMNDTWWADHQIELDRRFKEWLAT